MSQRLIRIVAGAGGIVAILLLLFPHIFGRGIVGKFSIFIVGVMCGLLLMSIIKTGNKSTIVVALILTVLVVLSMLLM